MTKPYPTSQKKKKRCTLIETPSQVTKTSKRISITSSKFQIAIGFPFPDIVLCILVTWDLIWFYHLANEISESQLGIYIRKKTIRTSANALWSEGRRLVDNSFNIRKRIKNILCEVNVSADWSCCANTESKSGLYAARDSVGQIHSIMQKLVIIDTSASLKIKQCWKNLKHRSAKT